MERIEAALPRLGQLPLGGTAIGTGHQRAEGLRAEVIARLAADLDLPLTEASDHFEAQGAQDALVETCGELRDASPSRSTRSPTTCG